MSADQIPERTSSDAQHANDDWPLFALGKIVATRGVLMHLEHEGILADTYLTRHACGDWGDLTAYDSEMNRRAVIHGARIFSSYEIAGKRVWIITEADRSSTTLLFPNEY
ncbi:type I restriction-modification system methyltransferase subunit [Burkholderia pseudomallei]|nr:type I restriction-modification system methyltransferase subunit [Burkholderia pseudomallei]CAJ5051262.1 type I restriction-modification system methyltransferase subunit [Burkholderia pseudomallei]